MGQRTQRPTSEGGTNEAGKAEVLQNDGRRGGRRMTDEEMADKYVIDTGNNDCTIEAFLAGLKAGRPKWHKPSEKHINPNYNIKEYSTCGYLFNKGSKNINELNEEDKSE